MRPHEEQDDDQHWFDLMAGRAAPDAHGRTRADAAWLRAAMLAYRMQPPPGQVPAAEQRVQRLLARAMQAGVLPPADPYTPPARPAQGPPGRPWWRRLVDGVTGRSDSKPPTGWRLAPALAVLALVVGLLFQQLHQPVERPDVQRGPALQQINAADPAQRQQQLVQSLRAAGLDAHPFERLGRRGVDIELPVPLSDEQMRVLQREGLRPPEGPSLIVEVLPGQ